MWGQIAIPGQIQRRSHIMNWDQVEGNWKRWTGKIKERWGKLTDNDLAVINGRRDMLVGRLQERYGKTRAQLDREVEELFAAEESFSET
jgi:uncharacterized protein YjbJ (UPF0337 family)